MSVEIKLIKTPKLKRPHLVCGLPGSGYVGKLAVDHLIKELKAELFAEVYSYYFPPHILIKPDGSIDLIKNELYFWTDTNNSLDLIIYTGDSQPASSEGDYELADRILSLVRSLGADTVFTFGAYITGSFTLHPKVYVTATNAELLKTLQGYDVIITNEGTITGMNGLILGLAKLRGMKGLCFLGETSGYIIDARASKRILEVFTKLLKLDIDLTALEERAREMEAIIHSFEERQYKPQERIDDKSRLGYIS
ncbi:MAG: proteasome assembly chaperone family protein [Nitrososphaerales archaeon]